MLSSNKNQWSVKHGFCSTSLFLLKEFNRSKIYGWPKLRNNNWGFRVEGLVNIVNANPGLDYNKIWPQVTLECGNSTYDTNVKITMVHTTHVFHVRNGWNHNIYPRKYFLFWKCHEATNFIPHKLCHEPSWLCQIYITYSKQIIVTIDARSTINYNVLVVVTWLKSPVWWSTTASRLYAPAVIRW